MPGTVSLMLKLLLKFAESKRGITFVARCSTCRKASKCPIYFHIQNSYSNNRIPIKGHSTVVLSNNVLPNVMKLMFIPLISLTKQKMN